MMPLYVSLIRFLIAGVDQLVAGPTSTGQKATAKNNNRFLFVGSGTYDGRGRKGHR